HDGLLVRDRGAVHIALGIAVEAAGGQHRPARRVLVPAAQTEHELVRRVQVRLRDAGALVEPDQRDRRAGLLAAPQHLLVDALERFLAPWDLLRLDQDLGEIWSALREIHHVTGRSAAPRWR